jgi:hypothetical protein
MERVPGKRDPWAPYASYDANCKSHPGRPSPFFHLPFLNRIVHFCG